MPTALRLLTLVAMLALARPVLAVDLNDCHDPSPPDFFTPAPWRPDAPNFLATACVGEPYSQIISIWNPEEFTVGGLPLALENSSLPTTDGISGLPSGLRYDCAPPNCVFAGPGAGGSGHSYCIEISGTPSAANPLPETYDLSFSFEFDGGLGFLFPVDYPSDLDPDAHVYLNLAPAGNCPEPNATVASVAVLGILATVARRRNGRTGA
jgi:hypothetical protein